MNYIQYLRCLLPPASVLCTIETRLITIETAIYCVSQGRV